jgi:phthalate 4,5-cis-dihydrodiol dehydrogenase
MTEMRTLRLGIIGLGRAALQMLPSLLAHPGIRISAVAARSPATVAAFQEAFPGTLAYHSGEALCEEAPVDAVYIATPHQLHAQLAILAARRHKHILVEKPMALSQAECDAMIAAAAQHGVTLVVGPSHAFDKPVQAMAEVIRSGRLGRVQLLHLFSYTDFLYRPRRPEELDTGLGGGIIYNQLPHQVDILRELANRPVTKVTAFLGRWDPERPTEGAVHALLELEGGIAATIVYSGYAHFDSDVWFEWVGENGLRKRAEDYGVARRRLAQRGAADEAALKASTGFTRENWEALQRASVNTDAFHPHFGHVIVCGTRGDAVLEPGGVAIYGDASVERLHLEPPGRVFDKRGAVEELYRAVVEGIAPVHDGRWGRATLAVCEAILQAGRTGQSIMLEPSGQVEGEGDG